MWKFVFVSSVEPILNLKFVEFDTCHLYYNISLEIKEICLCKLFC